MATCYICECAIEKGEEFTLDGETVCEECYDERYEGGWRE